MNVRVSVRSDLCTFCCVDICFGLVNIYNTRPANTPRKHSRYNRSPTES